MSAPESELVVGPEATSTSTSNTPKKKPAPQKGKLPLQFVYHPSPDGVDENLLIMLHGLGTSGVVTRGGVQERKRKRVTYAGGL